MSETDLGIHDEFLDEMLADFLDESGELLEQLNQNLLQLDHWAGELTGNEPARCDESLMNEMFRAAHSFKGLSAMLGLHEINGLTHKIENVFDAARNDQLTITLEVVELIFQSVDRLSGMVDRLRDPTAGAVDCEQVLADIQSLLQDAGVEREKTSQEDAESALEAALEEVHAVSGPSSEAASIQETDDASNAARIDDDEGVRQADPFDGVVDDSEIPSKYLAIFIDETEESLDNLTEQLLASDEEDVCEGMLIICHRIKGSADSIGLNRAARLAHFMEDLLQDLQQTGGEFTAEMSDAMLKCADALRMHVVCLRQGERGADEFGQVCAELLAARLANPPDLSSSTDGQSSDTSGPIQGSATDDVEDSKSCSSASAAAAETLGELNQAQLAELAEAAPEGITCYVGQVDFRDELPMVGLKAQLAVERISQLGSVFYCRPLEEDLDDLEELPCLLFGVATEEQSETIQDRLRIDGVERAELQRLDEALRRLSAEDANLETPSSELCQDLSSGAEPQSNEPLANGEPSTEMVVQRQEQTAEVPEATRKDNQVAEDAQ